MAAVLYTGGDPGKLNATGYIKGEVVVANAAGALTPLLVGPDGDVLTANSGTTLGVDWELGGGGGGSVNSVFGRSGNVVAVNGDYTKAQVGLGAVANALQLIAANNLSDLVNAAIARTNLGLGTAATQNSGAFDAAGAAAVAQAASQPLDSDLTLIAGLASPTGNVIQAVAGAWASQSLAQVKTSLVLVVADVAGAASLASPTFTGTITIPAQVRTGRTLRTFTVLTDIATILVDASLNDHFSITLGGNRTLGNPSNPPGAGQSQMILFAIRQDATGTRTLALDTKYRLGTDITSITLSTAANKTDYLGVRYSQVDDKWDVISFVRGY